MLTKSQRQQKTSCKTSPKSSKTLAKTKSGKRQFSKQQNVLKYKKYQKAEAKISKHYQKVKN